MPQKAILIMIDGSHSSINETEHGIMPIVSRFPSIYGRNGTMVKIAQWNPANPDERRYHVGKMAEFIQKGTPDDMEDGAEGEEQPPPGLWSWIKKTIREEMNKPIGANRQPREGRIK